MSIIWAAGLHTPKGVRVDGAGYDLYIGRWSRLFVPDLLDAAELCVGDWVLDLAAGTGEAALLAMATVGESGFVVGADVSAAMLATASSRLSSGSFVPVVMDAQHLAFRNASFDAVVCQLGLMFFKDPLRGLTEARRVLRPGRCASVCVISVRERAPMWGVLAEILSRYLPDQAATLNLSFALADPVHLKQLFQDAGFRDVRVRCETRHGVCESFDHYWAPIDAGVGLMPQAYLSLSQSSKKLVREEVRARLARFESGGQLTLSVEMFIAAGRA